jgi:SecD/SecF fusion protein
MAVDANVLIYERIREEMQLGKPLKAAVSQGFGRAFSVIFDSNLTTLITALVLLQFAEGSVQGFALTMSIGLLANLYTGLTVTHSLTDLWVRLKGRFSVGKLRIFGETKINFIRLRNFSVVLSAALIIIGLVTLIGNKGPNFAVDFSGGVLTDVVFVKPTSTGEVRQALANAGLTGVRVQKVTGENEFLIRQKILEGGLPATEKAIEAALGKTYTASDFSVRDTKSIGNEIGQEFTRIALTAVVIASLCILIYLGFRFQLAFGAGAVVALVHDVFITIGILTLLKREISLDVVSALLMVIGYSVNDTIVIFDRIRENLRTVYGKTFGEIANLSINQSLNRTTITSLLTFISVTVMFFVGGKGLSDFALTLMIGIIVGTYSSDFVATPIVYEWNRWKGSRAQTEKVPKRAGASYQRGTPAKSKV